MSSEHCRMWRFVALCVFLKLVLFPVTAGAFPFHWLGGSGDFGDTNLWSESRVPSADDWCIFTNPAAYQISATQPHDALYLDVQRGIVSFALGGNRITAADESGLRVGTLSGAAGELRLLSGLLDTRKLVVPTDSGAEGTVHVQGTGSVLTNRSGVFLGHAGTGTLSIAQGGLVTGTGLSEIGQYTNSHAILQIGGAGSRWSQQGTLILARSGKADITINSGGELSSRSATLASRAGSSAHMVVDGEDSLWRVTDLDAIARFGSGGEAYVALTNGGRFRGQDRNWIGALDAWGGLGTGTVVVAGLGSRFESLGELAVGYYTRGTLTVAEGGQVMANDLLVSGTRTVTNAVSEPSRLIASGADSMVTSAYNIIIGMRGPAELEVVEGARLYSQFGVLGGSNNATAFGVLNGAGSQWICSSNFTVGDRGVAELWVHGGARIENRAGLIGHSVPGRGVVDMAGADTVWSNKLISIVGYGGEGELVVRDGATIFSPEAGLGWFAGGSGRARLEGDAEWAGLTNLFIGREGFGHLVLVAGAELTSPVIYGARYIHTSTGRLDVVESSELIGGFLLQLGVYGPMEVNLSNSLLQADQWFDLAYGEDSVLTMTMHAATNRVVGGDWNLGTLPLSSGTVHMAAGSLIDVQHPDRNMYLGRGGYGELIAYGSKIHVRGDALIGYDHGGAGQGILSLNDISSMIVSGAVYVAAAERSTGSVTIAGFSGLESDILTVGTLGDGRLTVDTGGLTVREFWAGSDAGPIVTLAFPAGWWFIEERCQIRSVPEWVIGSDNGFPALLQMGTGTNDVYAPMIIEANGVVIYPEGSVNYVEGAIVNRGSLAMGGQLTCYGLRVEGEGQLELAGGVLQVSGDVEVVGPDAGANLLHSRLEFSSETELRLAVESEDRGANLVGFSDNRAIGTLGVAATVEVARTTYVWSLEGDGELVLADGATLYYVDATAWSGSVTSAGGQLIQVPVVCDEIGADGDGGTLLRWSAGAGLHFAVDWSDSLYPPTPFVEAVRVTATNEWVEWIDLGEDGRPSPTNTLLRFYRLRAWP